MATSKGHRVFMWAMIVTMSVGTVGAFFLPILVNDSNKKEQEQQQAMIKQLQEQQATQNKCPQASSKPTAKVDPAPTPPAVDPVDTIAELKTEDVTVGQGEEVKPGSCVELFFHGVLAKNGVAFSGGDNYAGGTPYRSLTTGFVPGFAEGLVGMKAGGERKIYIPAAKGYGDKSQGDIPANSDLIFVVRVTSIYKPQT